MVRRQHSDAEDLGGDVVVAADAVPGTAAPTKGISVLRAIAGEDDPVSFVRLLQTTRRPKGTLHRMLKALVAEGLVCQQASDRAYHLGLELLSLACRVLEDLDVRHAAREDLVRLRDATGEAVHLAVHADLRAVYVDVVESGLAVGPIAKLWSASELHSSAVGKAIAAFLPPTERDDVIRRLPMSPLTEHTITSWRALKSHLRLVVRQGYALNEQEESIGIHGIAAPVLNHLGRVIASVCTTIPSYRYDPSRLQSDSDAVMHAAAAISCRMGFSSPELASPASAAP